MIPVKNKNKRTEDLKIDKLKIKLSRNNRSLEGKNNNKSLEISNKSTGDSQRIESYKNKVLSRKITSKSKNSINKNHLKKIQLLQGVFKSLQ